MTNSPFFDFVNQKPCHTPMTNPDRGGWEGKSMHIKSENLSQKEAELILAEKENWMVTLVIIETEITNHETLGTLLYVFAYLFLVN